MDCCIYRYWRWSEVSSPIPLITVPPVFKTGLRAVAITPAFTVQAHGGGLISFFLTSDYRRRTCLQWRQGRDSNPRTTSSAVGGLANRWFQPTHPPCHYKTPFSIKSSFYCWTTPLYNWQGRADLHTLSTAWIAYHSIDCWCVLIGCRARNRTLVRRVRAFSPAT